ncbi:MAG: CoA transferase [Acidimicrobiia bacterium]|nr:CoA transferase [Acidimicrobiia bacterium]
MTGPLNGFKVIDLSQVVSGPLGTMMLADQGADVVKVEPQGIGDVTRVPRFWHNGIAGFYANVNRNKRAITLDLQQAAGREVLLDMCREADVFVQNFRPGAVDRLGVGYADVHDVNPDIIYVSVSGFGPDGPYSGRPVLDPVIQGNTGMISRQLNPEVPFPDLVRNLIADKSTALTVAQAVTAALLARERGQGGQHIEIPMLDATMYFFWPDGMMDHTMLHEDTLPGVLLSTVYNLTECADGKIVYFAISDQQRHGLFRALGKPELVTDERFATLEAVSQPENFVAMGQIVAEAFQSFPVDEILQRLVAEDVPSGPVLDAEEAFSDPQVVHNETLVTWEHPEAGPIRQPRHPVRFSGTSLDDDWFVSAPSADTEAVLLELGRSPEQVAALRNEGVIP